MVAKQEEATGNGNGSGWEWEGNSGREGFRVSLLSERESPN